MCDRCGRNWVREWAAAGPWSLELSLVTSNIQCIIIVSYVSRGKRPLYERNGLVDQLRADWPLTDRAGDHQITTVIDLYHKVDFLTARICFLLIPSLLKLLLRLKAIKAFMSASNLIIMLFSFSLFLSLVTARDGKHGRLWLCPWMCDLWLQLFHSDAESNHLMEARIISECSWWPIGKTLSRESVSSCSLLVSQHRSSRPSTVVVNMEYVGGVYCLFWD